MKDNIKELQTLIQKVPIKRAKAKDGMDTEKVYLENGSEGLKEYTQNLESLEEVELVEETPLPIFQIDKEDPSSPPEEENWEDAPRQKQELCKIHEHKLRMIQEENTYYILGGIPTDFSSLLITLMVEENTTGEKERTKLDLYERERVNYFAEQLGLLWNQNPQLIEAELLKLTDALEKYREEELSDIGKAKKAERNYLQLTPENERKAVDFLEKENLLENINELIGKAGVIGEENTRLLLFIISSTYKMSDPLHALVQGTSGSGKSHLINTIGGCFPPEDVLSMTRVTSKSFYHYTKEELVNKIMLIQDFDGLDEEAQYAFRELQTAGTVSSSTTYKDRYGNITSMVKTVKSHFASLLATTKAEVYYDNMSRSIIIGVDESESQTINIIEHQNKKLAGIIDKRHEKEARYFLQNVLRCVRPMEVINPYADRVKLPLQARMLRRLNSHYQAFVKQITLLHQYQRKKDERGRLIAEVEDLKLACDILFDSIMLKVDELDSSLRQFFDRMKAYIKDISQNKTKDFQFTQRDVRLALNVSKSSCFRYMEDLELLEYVQKTGGYANRGFKYKIVYWDDMEKIREEVKTCLTTQLTELQKQISTTL